MCVNQAAQNGFDELVKLLIEKYHAAANALSLDKKTPLHLAAEAGRKEVCQLLLSLHSDPNAKDSVRPIIKLIRSVFC